MTTSTLWGAPHHIAIRLAQHIARYDYNYPEFIAKKVPGDTSNKWSVAIKITPKCDIPPEAVGARGIGRIYEIEAEGKSAEHAADTCINMAIALFDIRSQQHVQPRRPIPISDF